MDEDLAMDEDLVYIEGDLAPDERERLLHLIRRAEAAGSLAPASDEHTPTWIVVVGWRTGDTGPVSVSRFRSQLFFSGPDASAVIRKLEMWLSRNGQLSRSAAH